MKIKKRDFIYYIKTLTGFAYVCESVKTKHILKQDNRQMNTYLTGVNLNISGGKSSEVKGYSQTNSLFIIL